MPKRKRKKKKRIPLFSRFKVGDRIRVKQGLMDVEYPDIPLGGWAGTIREVLPDAMYTVRWSRETLAGIHPIYKQRCDRDGLRLQEYSLRDDDLEPDPGGPLAIEQPTEIRPRPLSTSNQRDRVQMIFGLTSDDSLPEINEETLIAYRKYLSTRLQFPFFAIRDHGDGEIDSVPVQIVALVKDEPPDEEDGILCEVVEGDGTQELPLADLMFANRNSRLVQDYRHWFIGELADGLEDDYEEDGDEDAEKDVEELEPWLVAKQPRWLGLTLVRLEIVAFAAAYGAVMGAVVAVMPWAKWAACIGGGVWGAVMAIALAASARTHFPEFAPRFRKVIAVPFGLIAGAVQGAFLGVAVVALLGAALGTVAGLLLRRLIPHRKRPVFRIIPGGVVCAAACGVAAQAIYVDRVEATRGLAWGALIGLNAGLLFWLLAVPLMKRMANKQP